MGGVVWLLFLPATKVDHLGLLVRRSVDLKAWWDSWKVVEKVVH